MCKDGTKDYALPGIARATWVWGCVQGHVGHTGWGGKAAALKPSFPPDVKQETLVVITTSLKMWCNRSLLAAVLKHCRHSIDHMIRHTGRMFKTASYRYVFRKSAS